MKSRPAFVSAICYYLLLPLHQCTVYVDEPDPLHRLLTGLRVAIELLEDDFLPDVQFNAVFAYHPSLLAACERAVLRVAGGCRAARRSASRSACRVRQPPSAPGWRP